MLITKLKNKDKLFKLCKEENLYIIKCFGCKEVFFPEKDINLFIAENEDKIKGVLRIDYLCNQEFASEYIKKNFPAILKTDKLLIFSCGVGVQVVAKLLEDKVVLPGCDTFYLHGFQGVSSQDVDCEQCGNCYLNITGGICPLTACAKGLLNGPCGGADENGKCEVNSKIDCGWVLIYNRLNLIKTCNDKLFSDISVRDYSLISKKAKDEF
jgi:electron transport complex protein RnfC